MGLMMIPDTAHTFPELSDGVSKPNCLPELIFTGLEDYSDEEEFDGEDFELLLLSDNALDKYLYPNPLEDDFYQGAQIDDQYLYNLHEEPYQEKVNATVIEAAALKSCQVLISPELCHIVNPNEIFPNQILKKNDGLKLKVGDDVVLNNALSGKSGSKQFVKGEHEVHNDHCYVKGGEEVVVKVEEEEVLEEDFVVPKNVVVKVEAPAVKRPVGRPRKTPPTTKPVKRSAAHFDEETNEEIVDVESIDVKRPRKTPKAKLAPRAPVKKAPAKKALAQKRKVSKPSVSNEVGVSSTRFQAIDPLNPNGYVMRQAKTSALKKIAKTKKSPTVSRSKRSDHNDMERRRRQEMRELFDLLKTLVPIELLVDHNNKIKKNPSKNTILVGSSNYVEILCKHKKSKNSAVRKNQKLQKKHRRLAKALRKRCKKLLSRRNIC